MPDWHDTLAHIRHIDIPAADLARWEAEGRRLERTGDAGGACRDFGPAHRPVQTSPSLCRCRGSLRSVYCR